MFFVIDGSLRVLLERLYTGAASEQEVVDSQERFDNHYVDSRSGGTATRRKARGHPR